MQFNEKYSGMTYLPCSHRPFLSDRKKEKYINNYFNLVTHFRLNCWSFQERNLTLINGERIGHDLWNGKTCAVRVSYPYVTTKEYKWIKKLIQKEKNNH